MLFIFWISFFKFHIGLLENLDDWLLAVSLNLYKICSVGFILRGNFMQT